MFENFIDGFRAAETTAKGQEPASHYDSKNDHSEKELEVVGDKEYTNVDHLGMTSDGKPKITSDESGLVSTLVKRKRKKSFPICRSRRRGGKLSIEPHADLSPFALLIFLLFLFCWMLET